MIPSRVMRTQKLKLPLQYDYQKTNLLIQAGSLNVDVLHGTKYLAQS